MAKQRIAIFMLALGAVWVLAPPAGLAQTRPVPKSRPEQGEPAPIRVAAAPADQGADKDGPVLSAAEVKSELFGVEVVGDDHGLPWRECITPESTSVLYKDQKVYHGQVYVSAGGFQCFLYAEQPGYRWCWRVIRDGQGGYINEHVPSGSRQAMRVDKKGVKECSGNPLVG